MIICVLLRSVMFYYISKSTIPALRICQHHTFVSHAPLHVPMLENMTSLFRLHELFIFIFVWCGGVFPRLFIYYVVIMYIIDEHIVLPFIYIFDFFFFFNMITQWYSFIAMCMLSIVLNNVLWLTIVVVLVNKSSNLMY